MKTISSRFNPVDRHHAAITELTQQLSPLFRTFNLVAAHKPEHFEDFNSARDAFQRRCDATGPLACGRKGLH
jgi:hypothetical protein